MLLQRPFTAAVALALACGICTAVAPAAAQKAGGKTPPAARPVVLGTKQLPGDFGKFGTTYTVGTASPLNFTLLRAEYSTARLLHDTVFDGGGLRGILPNKGEKWLVIHYTVQNPTKGDVRVFPGALALTAVDAGDKNYTVGSAVVRESDNAAPGSAYPSGAHYDAALKPAQKVALMAAFRVPAQGEVPKLIVGRANEEASGVIRYDLRGKVGKLPANMGGDATGYSAADSYAGAVGKPYPWPLLDVTLEGVALSTTPFFGEAPRDGGRYAVATMTVRAIGQPSRLSGYAFRARLKTADGETLDPIDREGAGTLFFGGRDEVFDKKTEVGDAVKVRLVFLVPGNGGLKTLSLAPASPDEEFRPYVFDVSGVR